MNNNSIFQFSQEHTDGDASLTDLLGGKGANLAEMSKMGIQVPPGFTITTEVCNYFMEHAKLPDTLEKEIKVAVSPASPPMVFEQNGKIVGVDINATHHISATSGWVTAVATPISLGRTLCVYEIVITNEAGQRTCTARITCLILNS